MRSISVLSSKILLLRRHPLIATFLLLGLALRIAYDIVSTQSPEFINWMSEGAGTASLSGPLYPSIYTAGAYMFSLAYKLWSALPVDHPPFESIYLPPSVGVGERPPTFQPSAVNYVFVLTMKTPMIFSDLLIMAVIARVIAAKTQSSRAALIAATIWAWNPLVTILENYNGIDTVTAALLLFSVDLFERKKTVLTSITLTVGTLLRLAPALFLPAFALHYARRREWLRIAQLLIPSVLIIGGTLAVYASSYGYEIVEALFRQRPGIFSYEVLAFFGPILKPRLGGVWNGFLSVNLIAYFLLIGVTSLPRLSASFGDQVSSVLLAFFAFSWFHFAFLLWVLPFVTIYNLGNDRRLGLYILLTIAGLLWTIFQASTAVFSLGTSILFVPVSDDLYPISRALMTLQFYKGLEYLRAFFSGVLLAQLALVIGRNLPSDPTIS